jgi:hypothetical protein
VKHQMTISQVFTEIHRLESTASTVVKAETVLRVALLRAELIERTNRLERQGWKIPRPLKQAMGVPA